MYLLKKMDPIIKVSGLKKHYGNVKAVNGLDFSVVQGNLFAFLGPNGAGKSTTIDILCTFLKPDEGKVIIDGHEIGKDDDKIRNSIGIIFQQGLLDNLLTVRENLEARGSFYGLKGDKLKTTIDRAAANVGIIDLLDRQYGKLSGGQKRRADISRALIHTPKILFLDEPTTGLDPQTRKSVWDTIRTLQKDTGLTVFMTTHYMEEATEADYVIVIDNGLISARGTPTEIKEKYAHDLIKLSAKDCYALSHILDEMGVGYQRTGDVFLITLQKTMDSLPILDKCRETIYGFEVTNGTMDDAFLEITGGGIRE